MRQRRAHAALRAVAGVSAVWTALHSIVAYSGPLCSKLDFVWGAASAELLSPEELST